MKAIVVQNEVSVRDAIAHPDSCFSSVNLFS
ncbi:hypothetical protein LCGC14_2166690, partial [marine sediment metagenome]